MENKAKINKIKIKKSLIYYKRISETKNIFIIHVYYLLLII